MRIANIEVTLDMTDLIKISAKSMAFLTDEHYEEYTAKELYDAQYEVLGWFIANMHIERVTQSYWNGWYSNITLETSDVDGVRGIQDDIEDVEDFEGFLSFFAEWACSSWYNLDNTAPPPEAMDGWFQYLTDQIRKRGYNVDYWERIPDDAYNGGRIRKSYWLEVKR